MRHPSKSQSSCWVILTTKYTKELYLGEVFVQFRVQQRHLWFHVLVQDQGEHWEHCVDCRISAPKKKKKLNYIFEEKK